MTHEQAQGQLSAFVDRELSDAELATIEEHLTGCTECQLEVKELEGAIRALRILGDPKAPEDFSASLRKTIRARSKGRFYAAGLDKGGSRWMTFDLIAVLMLIVLISVALVFLVPEPASPKLVHPEGSPAAPELLEVPPAGPGLGDE